MGKIERTTIHGCGSCGSSVEVKVRHTEDCGKSSILPNVYCTNCEDGGLMASD